MANKASIGQVPVNPMHAELLTRAGQLIDRYLADGMPVDEIAATLCTTVGLLINYHYQPAVHEVALKACIENIREGLNK